MRKVLLLSKLYLSCIDNIKLFGDNKRFESEIMRVIAYNLLSILLIMLYFLHADAIIWAKNKYPFICEEKEDSFWKIRKSRLISREAFRKFEVTL